VSGGEWSNVKSASGLTTGTQPGAIRPHYLDSEALVSGDWDNDQFVQIVALWDGASGTDSD